MCIEQIIELDLSRPGVPKILNWLFLWQNKDLEGKPSTESVGNNLPLEILQKAMYLASLHVDQVNYKNYPKNARFWTWIVSKGKTEQFYFFNWLSNLKNLVLLNGSKKCKLWSNWH